MSIKRIITGLALSMLLSSGVAIAADYDSAYSTYQSGSFSAAFKEMLPFAEQGNIDAQWHIGLMYDKGKGIPKDDKTAVKWYTLAAEQGDAKAQFNLGVMYARGEGVPENDKTAVKWFTLAAEQGHAFAQSNLGIMYANGDGVLTDIKRAYMWNNLASYNSGDWGGDNKDIIAKDMTPADISKAQDMSSACLESNYTDC